MLLQIFQSEWESHHAHTPDFIGETVQSIVHAQAHDLADAFYSVMLRDSQALQFLNHDQVKTRLRASMVHWLQTLFADNASEQAQAIYAHQTKIGDVHARIEIPVSLVLKGARALQKHFYNLLDDDQALEPTMRLLAGRHFGTKIDLAMECMSEAYTSSHARKTRSSEAYRLFSITENLSTEKEKQKAALLDWESQVMYETLLGTAAAGLPRLRESEFGLWFRHKGTHAFQGLPETDAISEAMQSVDETLIPLLAASRAKGERSEEHVRELRDHAKNILFQLGNLFARSQELESGKDVLTRLLNRKFLPIVLSREIEFCRLQQRSFTVASIDIDYFKRINDTYGHEAGDIVIQQVATLLSNKCRGGDFLFRMGGEEFLMVLVDIDAQNALHFCERIRLSVKKLGIALPNDVTLNITVSIGVASYTGHPDYNFMLRAADKALYEAKNQGRDRLHAA